MANSIYVISSYLKTQEQRLVVLRQELQIVSEEATIQGDISWHDNFAWDDAVRRERMLIEQVQQLQEEITRYITCDVPDNTVPAKVGVWTRIRILEVNLTTGDSAEKEIDVVPLGAENFKNRMYHYLAPIVLPLMGCSVGDTKTVQLPAGRFEITTLEIKQIQ